MILSLNLFVLRHFQICLLPLVCCMLLSNIFNTLYSRRLILTISTLVVSIFTGWCMFGEDYIYAPIALLSYMFYIINAEIHTAYVLAPKEESIAANIVVTKTLRKSIALYFCTLFFNLLLSISIFLISSSDDISMGQGFLTFFIPITLQIPRIISEICILTSLDLTNNIQNGISAGFNRCILGSYIISNIFCMIFCWVSYFSAPFALALFSIVAVVYQVTGGIFTKGADIGADLAGKIQLGLKEDDSKNPASIVDNMGDLVGDCLGISFNALALLALAKIYDPELQVYSLLILGAIASGIAYAILALFNSRNIFIYLILTLAMYYISTYDAEARLLNLLDVFVVLTFLMLPKLFTGKFIGNYIAETAKNGAGLAITEGMGFTSIYTALLIFCMYRYSYMAFISPIIFLIPSIISLNALGAIADIA